MNPIQTLFLAPSLSRTMGGIHEIMKGLSRELRHLNVQIEALGLEDSSWKLDCRAWGEVNAQVFKCIGPRGFGYSSELQKALLSSQADLLHLHALWMYPSVLALDWNRHKKRPYLVTPNGMLEPWALRNSGWKKRIAASLYENRMLRGAACLQSNTEKEMHDFRSYGLRNPVAIIPNGVDIPDTSGSSQIEKTEGVKTLLFLGRIHPKKGLENAIRAWHQVKREVVGKWQFVIAGWDQGGHQLELEQLCSELGLRSEVKNQRSEVNFYGPAFGKEKAELLRSADAFILPSLSEGLPMAVLEAWAYSLPVLMTQECNLHEGFISGAALKIGVSEEGIAKGLHELFSMSNDNRVNMGARGHEIVKNRYTWNRVASQMLEVYRWVIGGGSAPECVIGTK